VSVVVVDGIATIGTVSVVRAESGVARAVVQIPASGSAGLGSATIDPAPSIAEVTPAVGRFSPWP